VALPKRARNSSGLHELRAISDYGDYAHEKGTQIMASDPVKAVARTAGGAVRHAAWWLRYRLNGQTHPAPSEPRKRPAPNRRSPE
jgi:hypothetical protein